MSPTPRRGHSGLRVAFWACRRLPVSGEGSDKRGGEPEGEEAPSWLLGVILGSFRAAPQKSPQDCAPDVHSCARREPTSILGRVSLRVWSPHPHSWGHFPEYAAWKPLLTVHSLAGRTVLFCFLTMFLALVFSFLYYSHRGRLECSWSREGPPVQKGIGPRLAPEATE